MASAVATSTARRRTVYVRAVADSLGSLTLDLPDDAFVLDIKEEIAAKHALRPPPSAQKLVFAGRVLANNERLEALAERVRPSRALSGAAPACPGAQPVALENPIAAVLQVAATGDPLTVHLLLAAEFMKQHEAAVATASSARPAAPAARAATERPAAPVAPPAQQASSSQPASLAPATAAAPAAAPTPTPAAAPAAPQSNASQRAAATPAGPYPLFAIQYVCGRRLTVARRPDLTPIARAPTGGWRWQEHAVCGDAAGDGAGGPGGGRRAHLGPQRRPPRPSNPRDSGRRRWRRRGQCGPRRRGRQRGAPAGPGHRGHDLADPAPQLVRYGPDRPRGTRPKPPSADGVPPCRCE